MRCNPINRHLLWKLLIVNVLPVIALVILITWLSIDHLAANYFMTLMVKYDVSPTETHHMFLSAVHRYLIWASGLALILAVLLSLLITRKVLRPLSQMAAIAGQMAEGDFSSRVTASSGDEVGRLGNAFNHMADKLAALEHLRKTMVADVAHELRTPLTNLRGYLEGLSDQVIPPSKATFDMLLQEIMRLVHLVEDLQQLAKADAAKAFLNKQPLSIATLLDQFLPLYQYKFQDKDIIVRTHFNKDSGQAVPADQDKLMHTIRNLIENAWQYTPSHGEVDISLIRTANGIRMDISNSGPGIAAENLPYIFERFFRADQSRSRTTAGGAGIGLAIVKEIIQAHGGRVGAESDSGKTTIWFELPG